MKPYYTLFLVCFISSCSGTQEKEVGIKPSNLEEIAFMACYECTGGKLSDVENHIDESDLKLIGELCDTITSGHCVEVTCRRSASEKFRVIRLRFGAGFIIGNVEEQFPYTTNTPDMLASVMRFECLQEVDFGLAVIIGYDQDARSLYREVREKLKTVGEVVSMEELHERYWSGGRK